MRVDAKVILLGSENVGKTCLVTMILKGKYRGDYQNTIGVAFCAKRFNVKGASVTLGIWDTAGTEKFDSISEQYIRNCVAAVICYDVSDRFSYEKAKQWIAKMKKAEPNCSIYLTGTKCDLPTRTVANEEATKYAYTEDCFHIWTSSKDNVNVTELFYKVASDYIDSEARTRTSSYGLSVTMPAIESNNQRVAASQCSCLHI